MRAKADQIPPALDGPFDAILAINTRGSGPSRPSGSPSYADGWRPAGALPSRRSPRYPRATAVASRSAPAKSKTCLLTRAARHVRRVTGQVRPCSRI